MRADLTGTFWHLEPCQWPGVRWRWAGFEGFSGRCCPMAAPWFLLLHGCVTCQGWHLGTLRQEGHLWDVLHACRRSLAGKPCHKCIPGRRGKLSNVVSINLLRVQCCRTEPTVCKSEYRLLLCVNQSRLTKLSSVMCNVLTKPLAFQTPAHRDWNLLQYFINHYMGYEYFDLDSTLINQGNMGMCEMNRKGLLLMSS